MAGIDRLRELKGRSPSPDDFDADRPTPAGSSGGVDIAAHMAKYDPIKKSLLIIEGNTQEVHALKAKQKNTTSERARKEVMSQMEKIMDSTNANGGRIKRALDEIKKENAAYADKEGNKDSAKVQMRNNLYQTHIRRFHSVMNDYNAAAHGFKQELQARTRREIKIVDSNLSDSQIESIIESGRAQDVIKEALISDNLRNTVQQIEERHLDILKLERQVLEIYELFRDLATLVDLQQESLDVIENRILKAKDYSEKAEVELHEAEEYQKKARAKRCCLLFLLLGILVAILAPVLLTQLKNT